MKNILLLLLLAISFRLFSQAPQGMNYQAVVRDASGNVLINQPVAIKFNIRQGSASGTIVYSETHAVTTDPSGSITLVIGQGAVVSGSFASINWSGGVYFNEVLLDATGGSNYMVMGNAQLWSVPYAFYSNNSGSTLVPATTGYTVKLNGVAITDSSLNFVALGENNFLTKTNYIISMRHNADDLPSYCAAPCVDSISTSPSYTDNTATSASIFVGTFNSNGCGHTPGKVFSLMGNTSNGLFAYVPAHEGQIYYVPINAAPVNMTVYGMLFGGWQQATDTFYQAFPNDPVVTGFNLPSTFTIQHIR